MRHEPEPSHRVLLMLPPLVALALGLTACGGGTAGTSNAVSATASVNRPPAVAKPLAAQTATVANAFSLDVSQGGTTFSDPDGDALAVTVAVSPSGSGLTASGATLAGTATTAGSYTVSVTASDGRGGTATTSFALTIAPQAGVPVLPAASFGYSDASIALPAQFRVGPGNLANADTTPADNPITNAGATLGRVLFYDKRLSVNDTVACASCHVQAAGFGDTRRFSVGFQGALTARHAMGLANARYYLPGRFFWDERAPTLEAQVLQPIQNDSEMGSTLPLVVGKLSTQAFYGPLFAAAFGDGAVTSDRIARALAQFVRAMVSYRSKYDAAFTNGTPNFAATFTAQEEQGRLIFEGAGRCNTCHGTVGHIADAAHNNGLDAVLVDTGAGGGRFKAPSLRNIALRAPYMHDGRFATLEQVIDHYDSGVVDSPALSPRLRGPDGAPRRLNLSPAQKQALVAFLGSLTDTALVTDPKFADPFPASR